MRCYHTILSDFCNNGCENSTGGGISLHSAEKLGFGFGWFSK